MLHVTGDLIQEIPLRDLIILVYGTISVNRLIGSPPPPFFVCEGMVSFKRNAVQCHVCWQGAHMTQALNVHIMHVTVHSSMKPKGTHMIHAFLYQICGSSWYHTSTRHNK